MNEDTISGRLITHNLLFSAEAAIKNNHSSKSAIIDLSSLINLMVLQDNIFILDSSPHDGANEILQWVSENIHLKTVDIGTKEIVSLAKKHFNAYLGQEKADMFEYFKELVQKNQLNDIYESQQTIRWRLYELAVGMDLLDENSKIRKKFVSPKYTVGLQIILRTFLYIAYTDLSAVPFTPDARRAPIVTNIVQKQEATIRGQLSQGIQRQFQEYPKIGGREIRSLTTPFAAIVFQRSKGDKKRILPETIRLRNEMENTRVRLSDLERQMLLFSRDESIAAEEQWKNILLELERDFGVEPNLINFKRGISFSKEMSEVKDNPKSWKAWFAAISVLPIDVILRLYYRRPVFEIHSLRRQLTGVSRFESTMHELFGSFEE